MHVSISTREIYILYFDIIFLDELVFLGQLNSND